jgi:hypothetical protein
MHGVGRTLASGRVVFTESLRLVERDGKVFYIALPSGQSITEFALVTLRNEGGEHQAVFENLRHDYPTRIVYRLDVHGVLVARIEGSVDGGARSSEWRFRKVSDGTW